MCVLPSCMEGVEQGLSAFSSSTPFEDVELMLDGRVARAARVDTGFLDGLRKLYAFSTWTFTDCGPALATLWLVRHCCRWVVWLPWRCPVPGRMMRAEVRA